MFISISFYSQISKNPKSADFIKLSFDIVSIKKSFGNYFSYPYSTGINYINKPGFSFTYDIQLVSKQNIFFQCSIDS